MKPRLAGLLLALAACGEGDVPDPPPFSVPDEPGPAVEFITTEVTSIGEMEGDAPYLFAGQLDAGLIGDSLIVTVDDGGNELRFFDRNGRFLRASAGRGEGPHELRFVGDLRVGGDGVIRIVDRTEIVRFDRDGEHIDRRRVDMDAYRGEYPPGMDWGRIGLLPDDHVLVGYVPIVTGVTHELVRTPGTSGVRRYVVGALSGTVSGEEIHRVGEVPGLEQLDPGHVAPFALIPFFRRDFIVGGGSPLRFFLIDTGSSIVPVVDPFGDSVTVIELPYAESEITESAREAWLSDLIAENPRRAEQAPLYRRAWADAELPDTYPLVHSAFVDSDGRLWVRRYPGEGEDHSILDVFSASGNHIGTMKLPGDVTGLDARGESLLVRDRDEWGVWRVKLYEFRAPG